MLTDFRPLPAEPAADGILADEVYITPREAMILDKLVEGMTCKGTADALGISPHTVEAHVDHVFTKLGWHEQIGMQTNTRVKLAVWWDRRRRKEGTNGA